jgi:ABC-type antimicrobial peptide transport system permease subunit
MTSDPVSRGVAGLITSAAQRMVGGATWLVTGGLDPGLRPVLTRNLASRPARAALTAAAVGLGVAAMLGVQIEVAGVRAQADASAQLRAGHSGLDVRASSGVGLSTSQLASLGGLSGVREVVPLYQKRVTAQAPESGAPTSTVTLVGVQDGEAALRGISVSAGQLPGSSAHDQIAIDTALLPALAPPGGSLSVGGSVLLTTSTGPRSFTVVGLTHASGVSASFTHDVIFIPAPELLSSFDLGLHASLAALRLSPGTSSTEAAVKVHQQLGGTVTTFDPGADSSDPLSQLSPLLILVSVLSVIIGAGVCANTVSLAALERQREIGLLRAAGASAAQVFRLLAAESTVLALSGAAAGIVGGMGLGAALQAGFGAASTAPAVGLQVSPLAVVLAALAGALAALVASAVPAVTAARVPILEALSPESAGKRERVHVGAIGAIPPLAALAAVSDLAGGALAPVGAVALLLAVALSLPLLAPSLARLLARMLGVIWPETEVAAASLRRRRNRTALTLSGLVTAIAAAMAGGVLVAGSLASGDVWISHLFIGDTLIQSPVTQPSGIAVQIGQDAGVRLTSLRFYPAVVDGDVIGMTAFDSATYARDGGLKLVAGSRSQAFAALTGGSSLLAPLSLAEADDWKVGTVLPVATGSGTTNFTIAGIVEHSFPAGDGRESLLIDSRQAVRFFGSGVAGFDALEVLTPGRGPAAAAAASRYGLSATSVSTIESATEQALSGTVGILPAVAWLAVAIAVLAVVNTLVVNVRQGRHELGLLRAVGLSRGQARRLVLAQAGLLGGVAAVLGVGLGCLLAVPLLVASTSPGFTPAFVFPITTVLALLGGVVVAVLLAGVLPARRAAAADIVSAVRQE